MKILTYSTLLLFLSSSLYSLDTGEIQNLKTGSILYVTASSLRVRSAPNLKGQAIGLLQKGDSFRFTGTAGDELTVEGFTSRFSSFEYKGRKAYVFSGFLSLKKPNLLKYSDSELAEINRMNEEYQNELSLQEQKLIKEAEARKEFYQNCDPCPHYKIDIELENNKLGCTEEKKSEIRKIMDQKKIRIFEAAQQFGDEYCIGLSYQSFESGAQCVFGSFFEK